jgi:hypothetical protein
MKDNYAASDAEDMPRFLKTMSHGKSHRELFIRETLKESVAADTSKHTVKINVRNRNAAPYVRTQWPYSAVQIVQEMTKSARVPGSKEPSDLSCWLAPDREHPVVEIGTL